MRVDIGNALAGVASPGVARESLERLDARVAQAHRRIEAGRADEEHGYAALNLPERTDPDAIRRAVDPLADASAVLTAGIGGSALGAATITAALPTGADAYYLDNVDPAWVADRLDDLPLSETALVAVSRSGTTAETLANFLVCREAFERAGVDWTERTLVLTGDDGPLADLAERHDLPTLPVPEGVPGRFSALSPVGLAAPAICGVDIEGLLAGGAAGAESLAGSLFDCPAYAYGAVSYALAERGAAVNAMMPYAESLETFAEWFAQLWAESLGKDDIGQTPARALGATDQHSQLQLYRAGPRDKLVTFVAPGEREDRAIPDPDAEALSYLSGTSLGELLDTELDATAASLAAAGRPSVRIELDRVDARGLGELLYGMEAACILVGELFGVDAFDQPAVEWGKEATRESLRTGDLPERPGDELAE
ncbi:glucose-6-phosphate isomerase [Halobacteriales archaeon QS_1_68_20]|nr:MAG: glucose-6-phosphate isomerase [Halobacteriales archaeon QS_1_68_20]